MVTLYNTQNYEKGNLMAYVYRIDNNEAPDHAFVKALFFSKLKSFSNAEKSIT
jgi:hypothetical protein